MTIREQVKKTIQEYNREDIQSWLVDKHIGRRNKWIEVRSDGRIVETENEYEDEIPYREILYRISTEDECRCYTCRRYAGLNWIFEEDVFFEEWDNEDFIFPELAAKVHAIRRQLNKSDEDEVINEMLQALNYTRFGYFDDEKDEEDVINEMFEDALEDAETITYGEFDDDYEYNNEE